MFLWWVIMYRYICTLISTTIKVPCALSQALQTYNMQFLPPDCCTYLFFQYLHPLRFLFSWLLSLLSFLCTCWTIQMSYSLFFLLNVLLLTLCGTSLKWLLKHNASTIINELMMNDYKLIALRAVQNCCVCATDVIGHPLHGPFCGGSHHKMPALCEMKLYTGK